MVLSFNFSKGVEDTDLCVISGDVSCFIRTFDLSNVGFDRRDYAVRVVNAFLKYCYVFEEFARIIDREFLDNPNSSLLLGDTDPEDCPFTREDYSLRWDPGVEAWVGTAYLLEGSGVHELEVVAGANRIWVAKAEKERRAASSPGADHKL